MSDEAPLIILIDDDSQLCFLIKEYLEAQGGYRVLTAGNGQDGWELLSQVYPSLIVCDVVMPGMDGYEFVQKLRRNPRLRSVPLIFLSAKGDVSDRITGLNAGGDVYLVKPFEPEELLAQIRATLARFGLAGGADPLAQLPVDTYLTSTERRVARLLSQGMTNQQVADELGVKSRTVENYVRTPRRNCATAPRAYCSPRDTAEQSIENPQNDRLRAAFMLPHNRINIPCLGSRAINLAVFPRQEP